MKRLALLALSTLALSACSETWDGITQDFNTLKTSSAQALDSTNQKTSHLLNTCPDVEAVDELSTLNEFPSDANTQPGDLISSIRFGRIESSCTHGKKSVTVNMKLAFEGDIGPKGKLHSGDTPFFSYPYFVAITAPNNDILAKEVFAASITYDPGESHHTYYESLRQIIPVLDQSKSGKYKVLVGFQLTNDQLAYNRAQIAQSAQKIEPAAAAPEAKIERIEPAPAKAKDDGPIDLTAPANN